MKRFLLLFALVLTVCSTVKAQEESLTMLSPVGTTGTLDGREAMVVDLGGSIGKVAIATMNVGATSIDDAGQQFNMAEANNPATNGLTDGWYVPSADELAALCAKLEANDSQPGLKWKVSDASTLYFPAYQVAYLGYCGMYVSSSSDCSTLVFTYNDNLELTKNIVAPMANPENIGWSVIRPFHKLPTAYSYVYPVYNDPDDVTKGVKDWETETVSAIEVTSSTEPVTLGERWTTTWYVVTGKDVTLSQGAICYGNVNLILADDAKLTATGADDKAGITIVADYGNSLTIYGQTAQSGQLIATGEKYGAGIGGGNKGDGADITINGGTVTANGGFYAAGIGGGYKGAGFQITINGGTVTANGGACAAGIGGGNKGFGDRITINGGTVTANDGRNAAGIGSGMDGAASSNIFVAKNLLVKAGNTEETMYVIGNYTDLDLASGFAGKRFATIEPEPAPEEKEVTYIDENGEEQKVKANVVLSRSFPVTWGEANKTTWYAVTHADVQLFSPVCQGDVRLILADGAKLTATGADNEAGIRVSDEGNSLTIYGQNAQSGQLIATGGYYAAGIGGGNSADGSNITINGGVITATGSQSAAGIGGGNWGSGSNITINGGTVTANCRSQGAGIGGGLRGNGSNITINGGTVTANGGQDAAGIGGGYAGPISFKGGQGSNIIINGGTVTANGGQDAAGIGSGTNGPAASDIFVATILTLKAGSTENPADAITNNGGDLASSLAGKRYVTVSDAICNITANQDPSNKANYYSTFYSGKKAYSVPEGVTAYTGVAKDDVLQLTPIADGIIPAGEAVILRLITEDDTDASQQIVLTATTTTATKSDDNMLQGSDSPLTLPTNSYALSLGQHGVGFYDFSGYTLPAHKAYLTLAAASSVSLRFSFGGATDIDAPDIDDSIVIPAYNLQGQQVDDSYRGIVIVNGKKVLKR